MTGECSSEGLLDEAACSSARFLGMRYFSARDCLKAMRVFLGKKRWRAAVLFVLLFIEWKCHAQITNQPITLRYITIGEFNNKGYLMNGLILWTTNHTSDTLAADLVAIEQKVGTNWVLHSRQLMPLIFQPRGAPVGSRFRKSHTAGYAAVQLAKPSGGTVWRIQVTTQPLLIGTEDRIARLKQYPGFLNDRWGTGKTNATSPFAKNVFLPGKVTLVQSQEISEHED
jgi:hypothetical protein